MKMNIKGLVFVGFAAAVFASAANAADKTVTSKTYVDTLVKDSTITLKQGNDTVGSFTVNQASDAEITIPSPAEQVQANWNEDDTQDPSYIQNKPTIPTVNDATLTVKQGTTTLGTFTANSNTATQIDIPVPTAPNDATISVTQNGASAGSFTTDQGTAGSITIVAPDWNAAAGTQGEILNKPTIGAGTITVTQDGQTDQTFTVNDSGDTTISIAAPWAAPAANYCTASTPCALVNDGTSITWERIQQ